MATAFYGGSIRVGYLPPNVTKNQIRNMSLDVLTVFPNDDFDPKNTTWTHFATPDERDTAFHYMASTPQGWDETDKRSFGGYIVMYVAGRLVTQSPEMTSINIIIESAGNFNFSQINPRFGQIEYSDDRGSLTGSALDCDNWTPCDYPLRLSGTMQLRTLKASTPYIGSGGLRMEPLAWGDIQQADGIKYNTDWLPFRHKVNFNVSDGENGNLEPSIGGGQVYVRDHPGMIQGHYTYMWRTPNPPDTKVTASYITNYDFYMDNNKPTTVGTKGVSLKYPIKMNDTGVAFSNIEQDNVWHRNYTANYANGYGNNVTALLANFASVTGCTFTPNVPNESIVVLYNTSCRVPSLQPDIIAKQLTGIGNYDPANSEIYALRNPLGTIAMYIRLNPNGIMTTVGSETEANLDLTPGWRIEFVQNLPVNSPLPVSSSVKKQMKKCKINQLLKDNPEKLGISKEMADILLD